MTFQLMSVSEASAKKLTLLVYGKQGTGKSLLASTVAEVHKTLYIDTTGEWGVKTFRKMDYSDNIDVAVANSLETLNEILTYLKRDGDEKYGAVVLDTISATQTLYRRNIGGMSLDNDISTDNAPVFEQQRWGKMKDMLEGLSDKLYGLAALENKNPKVVVVTAQEKEERNADGAVSRIRPAIDGSGYDRVLASPDYVVRTFLDEDKETLSLDRKVCYNVRIGPHPIIQTKAREHPDRKLPAVIGTKGRVTIPKLAEIYEEEL